MKPPAISRRASTRLQLVLVAYAITIYLLYAL
jgi:hypothetical protein